MKYFYILILFTTAGCCSQKIDKTFKSADFNAQNTPYAQSWTGGIPGSGSGINLFFPASMVDGMDVPAVYYNGQMTEEIEWIGADRKMMVARFKTDFNQQPDLVMDSDPKKEYGNTPPDLEKLPFELAEGEAVIVGMRNDKKQYFKVTGIEKRDSKDLPSRAQ
jgi:hypothetical protein